MQTSDCSANVLGRSPHRCCYMTLARRLLFQRDVLSQDLIILEFVSANLCLSQAFCLSRLVPKQAGMHEHCL